MVEERLLNVLGLCGNYPAVFVIELDQDENAFERVSYSYADVLTETVQLTFLRQTTRDVTKRSSKQLLFTAFCFV